MVPGGEVKPVLLFIFVGLTNDIEVQSDCYRRPVNECVKCVTGSGDMFFVECALALFSMASSYTQAK